jgi:hypothetical protein
MKTLLTTPLNWLAALLICLLVGSAWQLDGPDELTVMQQVADDKAALEAGK